MSVKRYWRIRGYNGSTQVFEQKVELGYFSYDQMRHLLQALAARGLTERDIVGACAKRGTKIANDLLKVHQSFSPVAFTCGSDPHFVADMVSEPTMRTGEKINPPTGS